MSAIYCIYHDRDLDGRCAGAIVRLATGLSTVMIGHDYGRPSPTDRIPDGAKVYMVDISLSEPEMDALNERCDLIWIDHHPAVIEAMSHLPLRGHWDTTKQKSAALLAWEHLMGHPNVPLAVRLISDYDAWVRPHDPSVLAFQLGLLSRPTGPEASLWADLLSSVAPAVAGNWCSLLIREGEAILRFQKQQDIDICKLGAFRCRHPMGYRVLALNTPCQGGSARLLPAVKDADEVELFVLFSYTKDDRWRVSLRTSHPDIDCAKLAQFHGGNGHKGAAGFEVDHLPGWLKAGLL